MRRFSYFSGHDPCNSIDVADFVDFATHDRGHRYVRSTLMRLTRERKKEAGEAGRLLRSSECSRVLDGVVRT